MEGSRGGGERPAVDCDGHGLRRFLDEYNVANERLHHWRNLFALALLPLLLWLSVRSRRVASDDPEVQASTRVLRRPISSWLVLVLASVVLLEPDAPILLQRTALLPH